MGSALMGTFLPQKLSGLLLFLLNAFLCSKTLSPPPSSTARGFPARESEEKAPWRGEAARVGFLCTLCWGGRVDVPEWGVGSGTGGTCGVTALAASWWPGQGSFDRPWLCWRLILQMETFLCQVDFQIWTLLECFAYFTRTGVKENTDFALLKNKQTNKKRLLQDSCLFQKRRARLKSRIKNACFIFLVVRELETSGFADWEICWQINSHAVSPGCAPAHTTPEQLQKFSCDCIHRLLQAVLGLGTLIEFK